MSMLVTRFYYVPYAAAAGERDGAYRSFRYHSHVTPLVPSGQPRNAEIDALRLRVNELEEVLAQRSAEVARVKSELDAFKIRYRQEVGLLHEELDDLERAIDEAERGERMSRLQNESPGAQARAAGADVEAAPRYTSDAVRRLFRDVAKAVHPDLAPDDHARERRHALMVEANRAYAHGDEERLRWILEYWERSPEAVKGDDLEAAKSRLLRRIAQIDEQLNAYADDLATLQDSPLWKLKAMVDQAAARGKDLVGEMVGRLKRDIMVARNRLDAIAWRP